MDVKGYQTRQKKILLAFLRQNASKPLSIEDIALAVQTQHSLGKSTVYRLMNQLVESGQVIRFVQGNGRHFVYQYMGCDDCHNHLHCRCVSCGRLYHLDGSASGAVQQMLVTTGFSLDPGKTTLLGTCAACGKESL